MFNFSSACILGLVALIAAGGCGSGSGRPTVPPPTDPFDSVPSVVGPGGGPPAQAMEAEAEWVMRSAPGLSQHSKPSLRAPSVATGDPELDPLVAYLKASFSGPIGVGSRLVIRDMTDVQH